MTLEPIAALITLVAEPAPELVIVPAIFTSLVEIVAIRVVLEFNVKFPVPVIPPVKVILSAVVAGLIVKSWLFNVTAPLKVAETFRLF